jgi:hypothetical protein
VAQVILYRGHIAPEQLGDVRAAAMLQGVHVGFLFGGIIHILLDVSETLNVRILSG